MGETVFWSWQSDLDGRVTREVIRYALDDAIGTIAVDLEEAERPRLTSDTQGVAGTPDIVSTILRKIDDAAVFVGDVTPIATSVSGKACANPNVLLEMGYANKAIGPHRVIQVWNTAFEGATLDKLPFDMRNRRGPLAFHLPADADTNTLRNVRTKLTVQLVEALKLAFNQLPPPSPETVNWQPHAEGEADLWFDPSLPQTVTNPNLGSSRFKWFSHWPGYARVIPSRWNLAPETKRSLSDGSEHPALLANANALSFGVSRGGVSTYWPRSADDGVHPTLAVTQWFEKTGEFWGVAGGFLFKPPEGRVTVATGYIYKQWLYFLRRNCALSVSHGGALPIHIRLGITDLTDSWWPRGQYDFGYEGFAAVEDSYEFQATITSIDLDILKAVVVDAFNGLADVYGVQPHTLTQIEDLAR